MPGVKAGHDDQSERDSLGSLRPRQTSAHPISGNRFLGLRTPANTRLRRLRRGRNQLRQKIGLRPAADVLKRCGGIACCNWDQSRAHVGASCAEMGRSSHNNGTVGRFDRLSRKPRAAPVGGEIRPGYYRIL
jgi:hypothetical protein